jgi:anti-sigma regulatory factor (Ser/Thr protein kinase)
MGHHDSRLRQLLVESFPADAKAPGAARHALRRLNGDLDPELAGDVRLLVSELVTNSLLHTGTTNIVLEVWASHDVIHVMVTDRGAGFVADRVGPGDATGGWGLFMVDRVARRWGVEPGDATRVWFELARPGRESARGRELCGSA